MVALAAGFHREAPVLGSETALGSIRVAKFAGVGMTKNRGSKNPSGFHVASMYCRNQRKRTAIYSIGYSGGYAIFILIAASPVYFLHANRILRRLGSRSRETRPAA